MMLAVSRDSSEVPLASGGLATAGAAAPPAPAPAPPTGPLPTAWCRTLLTALEQQGAVDRAAGHLSMLLSSFVEMELGPTDFGGLLAHYAGDPRPDIAEAAGMLQCAWERTTAATAPAPLPLQDQFWTLGCLLEQAGAHAAYVGIGPAGATLQGCGPTPFQRTLGLRELQAEHASQRSLHDQVLAAGSVARDRYATRLRLVGALLESQPTQIYELSVGLHCIEVESSDGSCQVFPSAETVRAGGGV